MNRKVFPPLKETRFHLNGVWRVPAITKDLDYGILTPVITLCLFGALAVFWAGLSPQFSSPFTLVKAKIVYFLVGIFLMIFFSKLDYHVYEKRRVQIYASIAVIVFLVLLLLP